MAFDLAALAVLLEAVVGYPAAMVRRIGHPVIWIGRLIVVLDHALNRPGLGATTRRLLGVVAVGVILAAAAAPAALLEALLRPLPFGLVVLGLIGSTLIAQRSLHWHVARVAEALEGGSLEAARTAVSHIVGRDPQTLDEAGVARAAIESLAENFSDGVVAPTLWMCVGGLAGGAAYKALNTADSMIGHLTERHAAFGWAAARADDYVNLPASRLAGMLLIAAAALTPGADTRAAHRAMLRDAPRHRSPNAGWSEAAMAGALGLKLNGPKVYAGVFTEDAYMGDGRREATADDVRAALRLYRRADALMVLLVLAGAAATFIWRG
ncbi:adenosylcobinamide-phosphate synthase CbiB [Xanthobacter autotrophicus]|uniref:adenosylcobinamide-phosphate synthase CbiB n=1 Tax=Xanthobacter TaxID=279 RepID=UPI0024AC341F|nr:adenosylcobinamide-phosphate synthase CbiB [Xanthobacter autotrophicus]MDI4666106.1 adenosylcobinamide-phosphate synthase CbiB [Xanthobacter autotrophicus]